MHWMHNMLDVPFGDWIRPKMDSNLLQISETVHVKRKCDFNNNVSNVDITSLSFQIINLSPYQLLRLR